MVDLLSEGLQLFLDHGVVALLAVLVLLLALLLLDEDRSALWRGRFFKGALALSGRRDYEKKYIANDLKGRLNIARRKLHLAGSTLPDAIDIQWVDVATAESYDVREGEYIVKLNPAAEQRVNVVRLAEAMVQRTTLRGIRHLAAPGLQQAIDNTMIRKLLHAIDSQNVLDYFLGSIYLPLRAANDEFRKWDEKIVEIDDQGLYDRLLLVELEDFGRRISPLSPRPYMLGEVESLVSFVHRLATKREGEDVPLAFIKAHVKVGVVLVAKTGKLLRSGIGPYVESFKAHARLAEVIYVIVWRKAWLHGGFLWDQYDRFAGDLAEQIRSIPGTTHDFTVSYRYTDPRGEPNTGMVSRYKVRATEASA
jgi:hypothetical protein